MSIAQRAVRGTALLLVSSYANLAIGFVTTTVLMRLLSSEIFGIFAVANLFFILLDPRNKLGLDYALIHRQADVDETAATHWILQIALSVLALLLSLIASQFLPLLGYPGAVVPVLLALGVIGIVEAAGTTARGLLEKNLRLGRSSLVVSGGLFVGNLTAIALAWLGAGVWSLVAQAGVNTAVSSAGFWWLSPYRPHLQFSPALARWLLRFGARLIVGLVATIFLLQGDNYMVATFVGISAAGYYVQAYKIAQWPTGLVTHVVSRAAMSTYAALQNDAQRLSTAFNLTLWVILSVATPLALILFVTAPDFVTFFFGEQWLPTATLLQALVGYSVLRPLLDDTGALFVATGRPQRVSQLQLSQAAALVIFALPLTLAYGALGTAIGVGLTFAVGLVIAYRFVNECVQLEWREVFGPPLAALAISLIITLWFNAQIDLAGAPVLARLVLRGAVVAGSFLAAVLILQPKSFGRLQYLSRLLLNRG